MCHVTSDFIIDIRVFAHTHYLRQYCNLYVSFSFAVVALCIIVYYCFQPMFLAQDWVVFPFDKTKQGI